MSDGAAVRQDKQAVRTRIWAAMRDAKVVGFPGAEGRIPNFTGAGAAATRLAALDVWGAARTLKANPDMPQLPVRTLALDYAGDTAYWPVHFDGRGLRNGIVEDVEAGVDHAAVQAKCREATERGDTSYMVVWAGQGVALMNEIKPIKVRQVLSAGAASCCLRDFARGAAPSGFHRACAGMTIF